MDLVNGLNRQLSREVTTFLHYMLQAASIKGGYESLQQMYLEEVLDKVEHEQYLANQIVIFGGTPKLDPDLTPPPNDLMDMLKRDSYEEKNEVKCYQALAELAEKEEMFLLKIKMDDQGAEEDDHGQERRRIIG